MIECYFDIDPGRLAINKAKRCKCVPIGGGKCKPASYKTDDHRRASEELSASARMTWGPDFPIYPDGPVVIEIESFGLQQHRKGPAVGLAFIDDDACVKAVRDALIGIAYTDDSQVVTTISSKSTIQTTPCIRVRIYRPGEDQ
jgi:Holliday junction resolvase RusA-like endonuclease